MAEAVQGADLVAFLQGALTDPAVANETGVFTRPTLYGESTRGAINCRYANRGGKPSPRTCSGYRPVVTVAPNPKRFRDLSRERVGVQPDVTLDPQRDWIEQVVESLP